MKPEQRQQLLRAARATCDWLKGYLVHTPREPLLKPIEMLIAGFELLDEKELRQAEAGREFGHLGKEYGNKAPAPGKKRGRPRKS